MGTLVSTLTRDKEGYDYWGFDKHGFDKKGFDFKGFDPGVGNWDPDPMRSHFQSQIFEFGINLTKFLDWVRFFIFFGSGTKYLNDRLAVIILKIFKENWF